MAIKGGKRAGAGRKPRALRTEAGDLRAKLIAASSDLITKAIEIALTGDAAMLRWCCDHLLGKPVSDADLSLLVERTALVRAQRELAQQQIKAMQADPSSAAIVLEWPDAR